jgi:hypothetical protein
LIVSPTNTTYNDIDDDELIDVGLGTTATGAVDVDYAAYLTILDKQLSLTRYQPNRIQQDYATHRTGRDLILKARQVGISTAIQADMFVEAVSQTSLQATLAHDADTTAKLRRMAKRFYENLSDAIRPPRSLDNATTTVYGHTGSEVTIATAGSLNIGRGGTYNRVHGSEVAFWKDADSIMSGLLQGVPIGGSIELESTANGAQGWFYDRCMEALNGDGEWTLHFYPWWWQDEYRLELEPGEKISYTSDEQALVDQHGLTPEQIKWRRGKQQELPFTFAQEYPEDPYQCFLTSGKGFFGNIEHVYTAPLEAQPVPGEVYIAGLDFGQTNDWTVLIVLNKRTYQMVDMLRISRLKWQDMRAQIARKAHYWNNAQVIGEANNMGQTNIELLQSGEYDENGNLLYTGIDLYAFDTTPQSKPPLIRGVYHALHEQGVTLQAITELRHEIRSFISKQTASGHWSYEGGNGAHDDTVIALALAWHGAQFNSKIEVIFA